MTIFPSMIRRLPSSLLTPNVTRPPEVMLIAPRTCIAKSSPPPFGKATLPPKLPAPPFSKKSMVLWSAVVSLALAIVPSRRSSTAPRLSIEVPSDLTSRTVKRPPPSCITPAIASPENASTYANMIATPDASNPLTAVMAASRDPLSKTASPLSQVDRLPRRQTEVSANDFLWIVSCADIFFPPRLNPGCAIGSVMPGVVIAAPISLVGVFTGHSPRGGGKASRARTTRGESLHGAYSSRARDRVQSGRRSAHHATVCRQGAVFVHLRRFAAPAAIARHASGAAYSGQSGGISSKGSRASSRTTQSRRSRA